MRYLVDGCYGDGNVGDECLLDAMCRLIRRDDSQADIRVMSADAAATEQEHDVPAVEQCNPFGRNIYGSIAKGLLRHTVNEIRRCQIFVLGGGELFRDSAGPRATLGMFYRMRLARWFGKPVVALGVGAQLPTTWWGPTVLRAALQDAHRPLFRDPTSLRVARRITGSLPSAQWAPDPVFSLDWATPDRERAGEDEEAHLGIAVKALPTRHASFSAVHHDFPRVLAESLELIAARRRCRISLLPFSAADQKLAKSLGDQLTTFTSTVIAPQKDALKRTMSNIDGLIALPLHASVFAFALGVPAVGLAYDAKVTRLYEHFGVSDNCLSIQQLDATCLAERVDHLLNDRDLRGRAIRDRASAARLRFMELASQLLSEARQRARVSSRQQGPRSTLRPHCQEF